MRMENQQQRIQIDQNEMLDYATGFGLLCRVCVDALPQKGAEKEKKMVPVLCGSVMLAEKMGEDGFQALTLALIDASVNRAVLEGRKEAVHWPLWDPEDHHEEDCHPLADVFFMLYGYVLYAQGKIDLPDHALGAVFTLSGVALEGIARGYHCLDDNMKQLYPDYRALMEKVIAKHGDFPADLLSSLQGLCIVGELRQRRMGQA